MDNLFSLINELRISPRYKPESITINDSSNSAELEKYLNAENEQQKILDIIDKKHKLVDNALMKKDFLGYINELFKKEHNFGVQIPDFVEYPQIDTKFMLTINCMKFRGGLNKFGSANNLNKDQLNDIYEGFLKMIKSLMADEEKVADYEISSPAENVINFVNFNLSSKLIKENVNHILGLIKGDFGIGDLKSVNYLIDYSSPNVAKQMTVGHLRSTLLGATFKNLFEKKGKAVVVGINHLGDWGEQFGKIFYSMLFVDEQRLQELNDLYSKNPNKVLFEFYVAYKSLSQDDESAKEFVKKLATLLSQGDSLLLSIWQIIKQVSLKDFQNIYSRMGVEFESSMGEAYFELMTEKVLEDVDKKGYLINEDGNLKIYVKEIKNKGYEILSASTYKNFINDENVFQKTLKNSDGVTNYLTRDIAAFMFRSQNLGLTKYLYLTGAEQTIHFEVLYAFALALDYISPGNFTHIPFGLYLKDGKKMSSRDGNVLKLTDVFDSVDEELQDKVLSDAAIMINDLKQQIMKGVEFDPKLVSSPYGDTGVYLLYTAVRWKKILNDLGYHFDIEHLDVKKLDDNFVKLLRKSLGYEQALVTALSTYKLNIIVNSAFDVAHILSTIYGGEIKFNQIKDKAELNAYLCVIYLGVEVIQDLFNLINIQLPIEIKRN
ncbi:MAG: arginine--tRNA ligase [Candidatus Absconditabacteria bacterium]